MNIYKVLVFDGYSSRELIISGHDVVQALQSSYNLIVSQVIKIELVGSGDVGDLTDQST